MAIRPAILPPLSDVIDSTIRSDLVACPTKYYYSFLRNLGPKYASTDLIAGGAYARGLEIMRKAYYTVGSPQEGNQEAALLEGKKAALVEYGDHEPEEKKQNKSVERVLTALDAYVQKFPLALDYIQPRMVDGKPSVEFTFSLPTEIRNPCTGNPFVYAGRFDMVGVYQGQLVVVDDKSTSQLGPTWVNQWNLRGQFTGYVYACRSFGIEVIGAIARGCSFLSIDKKTGIPKHEFMDSLQLRPQWMLDQWWEQLHLDLQMLVSYHQSGLFPQVFADACAGYSGCAFQKLCTSPDPETWIPGNFGLRSWDPLAKIPFRQPEEQAETVQAPDELLALMGRGSGV